MAQTATKAFEPTPIARSATAIDRSQLTHMTFGDRVLERELLLLFDRQAELLMTRMLASDSPGVASLAHTLKGSALGVGASNVARAADAAQTAAAANIAECRHAVGRLVVAVDEARAAIAVLLHTR